MASSGIASVAEHFGSLVDPNATGAQLDRAAVGYRRSTAGPPSEDDKHQLGAVIPAKPVPDPDRGAGIQGWGRAAICQNRLEAVLGRRPLGLQGPDPLLDPAQLDVRLVGQVVASL